MFRARRGQRVGHLAENVAEHHGVVAFRHKDALPLGDTVAATLVQADPRSRRIAFRIDAQK